MAKSCAYDNLASSHFDIYHPYNMILSATENKKFQLNFENEKEMKMRWELKLSEHQSLVLDKWRYAKEYSI